MIGRVPLYFIEHFGNSYNKSLTFNWKTFNDIQIRTHISTNIYDTPPGLNCDQNCKLFYYLFYDKGKTDWFFAETKMKYTFDPWYFFGRDFSF